MESNLGFNGYIDYQNVFTKTVTLSESQDCVVPDTLPDIAAILCTSGCILIRSKDVAEGHVRLEANIPTRVCCAGEGEGQSYCLDVNVPFFINAEDDGIRDGSVCMAQLTLKHLEARMLNPRKITVRAEISADVMCYSEISETFSTAPEEESDAIHTREQTAELTAISCVTEKTFVLTDESELSEDIDAAEIVAQNADILIREMRSVGSKLILSGIARSDLILRTEGSELKTLQFQSEFSQIVETQTETENALFEARMLTSGMYYELTADANGKTVTMELHLVAQVVVYAQRQVRFLADAYSNSYKLEVRRQQREIERYGREILHRETIGAAVETAGEVSDVIACSAVPVGWSYDGAAASVQLLIRICWKSGGTICSAERTICSRIELDVRDESLRICGVSILDAGAAAGNGGAEIRVTLEIRGFTVQRSELDCIFAIEYDESSPVDRDDQPTLAILYPTESGDLWTLAKEYCSTVEAICAANALDGEEWPAGRLLLIPKTL